MAIESSTLRSMVDVLAPREVARSTQCDICTDRSVNEILAASKPMIRSACAFAASSAAADTDGSGVRDAMTTRMSRAMTCPPTHAISIVLRCEDAMTVLHKLFGDASARHLAPEAQLRQKSLDAHFLHTAG